MHQHKPTEGYTSLFTRKLSCWQLTNKVLLRLRECLFHFLPLIAGPFQLQAGNVSNLQQLSSTSIVSLCQVVITFYSIEKKKRYAINLSKEIKTRMSPIQLICIDMTALIDTVLLFLGGMAGWCHVRMKQVACRFCTRNTRTLVPLYMLEQLTQAKITRQNSEIFCIRHIREIFCYTPHTYLPAFCVLVSLKKPCL